MAKLPILELLDSQNLISRKIFNKKILKFAHLVHKAAWICAHFPNSLDETITHSQRTQCPSLILHGSRLLLPSHIFWGPSNKMS